MKASIRLSSISRSQPILPHILSKPLLPHHRPPPLQTTQIRTVFSFFRRKNLEDDRGVPLSVAELLQRKPSEESRPPPKPQLKRGELASSSIFEGSETATTDPEDPHGQRVASRILQRATSRTAILKEGGMHPSEASFMRNYRIRAIKRRGRLSRTETIMRTEKQHLCKSHNFKTSLKKLGPLARQIAGKQLDDAMTQMKFSPKKAAQEILKHLQQARNEAVYTKNFDPAETYISQAWVGRGTPDREPLKRARGRVDVLVRPYTSISVILKENKTLERLEREKEEKRRRQKVWVSVPNRPIYGQHQYYQW
ncbi:54S ribosomal protein L22, mitochondrial [Orbilia ellipsospora]|uniref:54S ribosomal protein L22, mitochondrial n=1 Tax=Orbilia ellipsospora TaxID=2528407 RepID=A0AAV9WU09_9PEZI